MHTETLIDTLELWGGGEIGERDEKAKDFFFSVRVDLESSRA